MDETKDVGTGSTADTLEADLAFERQRNRVTLVLRGLTASVSAWLHTPIVVGVLPSGELFAHGFHTEDHVVLGVFAPFPAVSRWFPGTLSNGGVVADYVTEEELQDAVIACVRARESALIELAKANVRARMQKIGQKAFSDAKEEG